jgi:hypothetical protein
MVKFMKSIRKFLYIFIVASAALTIAKSAKEFEFEETDTVEIEEIGNAEANAEAGITDNWDKFIEAVIWKESKGVEDCIGDSGKAIGVLQIHPIMVREANRILKMNGKPHRYEYDDRYSREKSIEIFKIVQDYHNASHDHARALDIWNHNHPKSYYTQIMDKYYELI